MKEVTREVANVIILALLLLTKLEFLSDCVTMDEGKTAFSIQKG